MRTRHRLMGALSAALLLIVTATCMSLPSTEPPLLELSRRCDTWRCCRCVWVALKSDPVPAVVPVLLRPAKTGRGDLPDLLHEPCRQVALLTRT